MSRTSPREESLPLYYADHIVASEFPAMHNGFYYQVTWRQALQTWPHSHDFYEIIFVLEGECNQRINGSIHRLTPSTLCILRPGDVHSFSEQTPDTNLIALSVSTEIFDKFFDAYGEESVRHIKECDSPPVLRLSSTQRQNLLEGLDLTPAIEARQSFSMIRLLAGKAIQHVLLRELESQTNNLPVQFVEAIKLMRERENAAEGLSALLRISNYSHSQLCRLMQRYAGITPHQFILQQRMNNAYELLISTSHDIDSISEMVGYSSPCHFRKTFQQFFGMSPTQLRKSTIHYDTVIRD